jgi:hypothetical protein
MFLVGHTALGIAMAATVGATNPVGAFAVGWLSHYIVDFAPHGDEKVGEWAHAGNVITRMAIALAIDVALIMVAAGIYIAVAGFSWWACLAAVGATVPDVLWGMEMFFKRKLFGWHEQVHHANHNAAGIRMPLWLGLGLQAVVTVAAWWWVTVR